MKLKKEKGYDLVTTQIPRTSLICCRFKQLFYQCKDK